MTKEEQKKLLKLAVEQHEQLVNLLKQILIEVKQKK
mgnify:FL=1|jgi:N-dimethylarginine dimethylaminohydrolase|tara:strand:+ start:1185 stop:1292 length:108 start_codon:yes stop_codon:yes gene_type:complete